MRPVIPATLPPPPDHLISPGSSSRGDARPRPPAQGGRSATGRLIVASNRLPFTARRAPGRIELAASSGGLVTAMRPALESRGGSWIGWLGEPGDRLVLPETGFDIHPVGLAPEEVARYYDGFSNQALWPLFHSLVHECSFDEADWRAYDAVNERFARAILEAWKPGDVAWIHDYHLTRVPHHLRRLGFQGRIAFFLHVPFPHVDILRALPWANEILDGILSCDLAGFHVKGYAENFLGAARELRGAEPHRSGRSCSLGGHRTDIGAFPIGIDAVAWESLAKGAANPLPRDVRLILGVDRMDYTKGIPQRLLAFERFLEDHPERHGKVQLLQLAVPSRDDVRAYRRLKRTIDEMVGRINGRFATPSWSPVRYLHRSMPPRDLAGLYRHADVMLVTPLRDGMNLVAKEYVACQGDEPGVLVLSALAGAADDMRDALLINPHDVEETAQAIEAALGMPPSERRWRMQRLRHGVRSHDVHRWAESFLAAAARSSDADDVSNDVSFDAGLDESLADAVDGRPAALLLDFDGTLCPIVEHPDSAALPARTRRLLEACAARRDTTVAILSGRSLEDLRGRLDIPGLILAGNHGLEIEGPGLPRFVHDDLACFAPRMKALADRLERVVRQGAWVERKGASLTIHLRAVPARERPRIEADVTALIASAGFQARGALMAVEARPPIAWDKGLAAVHVLRALHGPAWAAACGAVAVGDDATDEDMFTRLVGLAATFRVGTPGQPTAANRVIPRSAVEAILQRVLARPAAGIAAQAG